MIQLLLTSFVTVLVMALVGYQFYKITWLRHHGRRIVALVTSVRQETGKTVWGIARDNYYVTAAWTNPRSGQRYTFWTWIMDACPAYTQGSLVPVLIDPDHPECYTLDL